MTYWNEKSDLHIRYWDTDTYPRYYRTRNKMSSEGYRGDDLQPSEVIYLGSCDLMTSIYEDGIRWSDYLHAHYHKGLPFINIGVVGAGLPTMVRKLYAYIKNYGAPRIVYMTVPRFDGYEYVNKTGRCYNASSRMGTAYFSRKADLITKDELDTWIAQLEINRKLNNIDNNRYILEERFSFIELMCKAHNITLKWTFNPSDASIITLHRNIDLFEDISDFMKKSFVGLPAIKDHVHGRVIGKETHREIYNMFVKHEPWDFDMLKTQSLKNQTWLLDEYGQQGIVGEG